MYSYYYYFKLAEMHKHFFVLRFLFLFVGYQQLSILPKCVSYILIRASRNEELDAIVKLAQPYQSSQVLAPGIKLALDPDNKEFRTTVWENLLTLSKWVHCI